MSKQRRIEKIALIFIIFLLALAGAAQTKRKVKSGLPVVGTIKNYEATGLTMGCNNLYFTFPEKGKISANEEYVFISRSEGADAWMNLDGRDTALQQIKYSKKKMPLRFYYRARNALIGVLIEDFKPRNALYEEGDSMFKMRILLRRGRIAKTIRAVGYADC